MNNTVPAKLINCKVYNGPVDLLGFADVTLPDIEYMSESIKGAGIAGEADVLTLGHFASMKLSMTWRTITSSLTALSVPVAHDLDIRAAQQLYDAGSGQMAVQPVRVYVKALPKKSGLGKAEPGAQTGSTTEMEVVYIKVVVDGSVLAEIDKFNYICNINGTDYLALVRTALGMA